MKCVKIDNFTFLIIGFLLFTSLAGCRVDHIYRDFLAYYYPVYELQEGKVYEYRPVSNDTLPVDYWYYSSHKVDDELHFTGNYYNDRFEVKQFFREVQSEQGVILKDFILYESDSTGNQSQIPVEILGQNTFPQNYADSTKTYKMGIKWDIPGEVGTTISLFRERNYIAKGQYTFKDKRYDSVLFKTLESIEHFVADDGYLEPSFPGIEIYAKGLGLVYYKKQLSEQMDIEYELHATYSMSEFEDKFKRSLEEK